MSGSSKLSFSKPLKGEQIISNYGSFDTISANSLILETVNIAGVYEDGVFVNVSIKDSEISNTIIGLESPSSAYFSYLQTIGDVLFNSNTVNNDYLSWNPDTGVLYLSNDLEVDGCAKLGNIEICRNDIKAINTNGDINIIPNNTGVAYVRGAFYHTTTVGNFFSEVINGSTQFNIRNNFNVNTSVGGANITTFDNQNYTVVNGDITLTTESPITRNIVSLRNTNGNVIVTTNSIHNLKAGDVISMNGTGLYNNDYTVGSVVSETSFLLSSIFSVPSTVTTGTLLKQLSNKIVLNTQNMVTIPANTELVFGSTNNNIVGDTSSLAINSLNDISFSVGSTSNSIIVPETVKLQFGTSGNNYINFLGNDGDTSLNLFTESQIKFNGDMTQINTTNTSFYDPILTIADYVLNTSDNKDRGIEYRYYDATTGTMKLGWFGYKTDTRKFTFIPDATNTNEFITGTPGNFEIGQISTTQLEIASGGTLNLNCGNIIGVNTIFGCGGIININATQNLNITSGNRISLIAGNDIYIPNNVPIVLGSNGSRILENTSSNLIISSRNINLSASSTIIPVNAYISFSGNSLGTQRITANTSGELLVNSNNNIYITTTSGNIIIPSNTNIQLGNSSETIYGNTIGVTILTSNALNAIAGTNVNISSSWGNVVVRTLNSGDIQLYTNLGVTRILDNKYLVFSNNGTSNSILTTSGDLVVNGDNNNIILRNVNGINLFASNAVNIPTNVLLTFTSSGSKYITSDTIGILKIVNNTDTAILNTVGQLFINNLNTSISSSNFNVEGAIVNLNTQDVRIKDPIVTLANYTTLNSDGKDRGIEYRYYDTTSASMKLGWFGWKNNTNRFTYYSDAINTNEVITGTAGQVELGSAFISNNLTFLNTGLIDMNCGTIANVRTIIGCGGVVNVIGTNSINMTSSNIMLNANTKVQIPSNIPLVFGSTSSNISGDTNGNIRIAASNNLIIDANVQINGTTTNVYSTVTNIEDPIVSLGGVIGPIINDNKDRGIEFKWNNGSITKTGFFGYKNNLSRFVFIQDGINNNEVYSGSYGDVQFGTGFFSNLNLNNGVISNVKTIIGNDIYISSGNVLLPYDSKLAFGNTSTSISSTTSGNLIIAAAQTGGITLSTNTNGGGYININENTSLNIGRSKIIQTTNGNLQITNTSGDIELSPTQGVIIPTNKYLEFGSIKNSIISDGDNLILNGYSGINMNSSTVTISGSVINIMGELVAPVSNIDINKYILPLGTFQLLDITSISNYLESTNGNIRITTDGRHYLVIGDKVILNNTNSNPKIDEEFEVKEIIDGFKFLIFKTGGVTLGGTTGIMKSNLKVEQGKDVGIGVNYWKDLTGNNIVTGSINYHTGFFGWKNDTSRWTFYKTANIVDNVVQSGEYGDIQVNKVFTNKMSGFVLEGIVSTGSYTVTGSDFRIGGGTINTTPIGATNPQTGRFTNLSNTVAALFRNVTMETTMDFKIDRYTISSVSPVPVQSPNINSVVTVFSIVGVNFTSSVGTMQSGSSVKDGTYKVLVCGSLGVGCQHTIYFGSGRLICPNPLNASEPTRLVFKRAGQSCSLIYDDVLEAWILLNSGAYVF